MNRGLLEKSLRENWPLTLGFGLLFIVVETVISFVLPAFHTDLYQAILQMGFVRSLLSALLGTPINEDMGTQLIHTIPWVHPVVLLTVFAHEITVCTRLPAGEIDRGTIDVLLGLPISRTQVYICHTIVWLLSGVVLMLAGLLGNWIGTALAGSSLPSPGRMVVAISNGYCLYVSIGCLTYLISCLSNSRGRAVGAVLALVVGSFLITFLAEFWSPAKHIRFLSLLNYYQPLRILENNAWPLGDLAVLTVAAVVFWTAGSFVFRRRDIAVL